MDNRWTFDNDKLFELVRIGRKRGTCSRNSDEEPMAKIGDVQEIYNSRGKLPPCDFVGFVTLMTHGQK